MSERRPLIEGVKLPGPRVDPTVEKRFVFGDPTKTEAEPAPEKAAPPVARAPLTTRLRADYVTALKRISLERQLSGTTPHTLQEFLEEALEPRLKTHGGLP
jgi:hypothetical protein